MIVYSPFWETLKKSNENWYSLTNNHHISSSTLHRLKHNKDVSTKTLNDRYYSQPIFWHVKKKRVDSDCLPAFLVD